jgi:hypothetical protein
MTRKSNAQVRSSLGQAVAEHVVVGVAVQPFGHLGADLTPVFVGPLASTVIDGGDTRRR